MLNYQFDYLTQVDVPNVFFFRLDPTTIDYQTPVTKEAAQCNVTLHSDRLTTFKEKSTPSLGDDPTPSIGAIAKPAIVFRKRKVVNQDFTRKREEEN